MVGSPATARPSGSGVCRVASCRSHSCPSSGHRGAIPRDPLGTQQTLRMGNGVVPSAAVARRHWSAGPVPELAGTISMLLRPAHQRCVREPRPGVKPSCVSVTPWRAQVAASASCCARHLRAACGSPGQVLSLRLCRLHLGERKCFFPRRQRVQMRHQHAAAPGASETFARTQTMC